MFLPGESQGLGSLVGCHLRGRRESDMTELLDGGCKLKLRLTLVAPRWAVGGDSQHAPIRVYWSFLLQRVSSLGPLPGPVTGHGLVWPITVASLQSPVILLVLTATV